jgi:hypothetical protein
VGVPQAHDDYSPIGVSFMTLTTVGYGDVLPISGSARAAVTLEAVLGHFYLAVLVARLVGLHIADTRRPS